MAQTRPADAQRAAERPLDLHEAISPPEGGTGCPRWPEHLRLLNETTGELVLGRCHGTNVCTYCQTLYVVETVEMLTLDAMEHAPTLWAVLTAREHLTRRDTYRHLEHVLRAVRRRWPDAQWFVQVEFQKRGALHLNLLIKGVPVSSRDELRAVVNERWCARVDAEAQCQYLDAIADGVGVVRYLSKMLAHGLKAEQRPPIGWRGHRTSQTRGYLVRPASIMRDEARAALRLKRKLWRGLSLEVALHELAAEAHDVWTLHDSVGVGADPDRVRSTEARAPFKFAAERTSRPDHPGPVPSDPEPDDSGRAVERDDAPSGDGGVPARSAAPASPARALASVRAGT